MTINGLDLPGNFMNSGSGGANPAALTANEFDGYLVLDDGSRPIHLPWHVLPRKAANVVGRPVLTFSGGVDSQHVPGSGGILFGAELVYLGVCHQHLGATTALAAG